jgi:hypothetical protein
MRPDELESLAGLCPRGNGRALVVGLLSAGEGERDLHAPIFEIEVERKQGIALPEHGALEVADFLRVQEELSHSPFGVRKRAGREKGRDVHLPQPYFASFDGGIGFGDVGAPVA